MAREGAIPAPRAAKTFFIGADAGQWVMTIKYSDTSGEKAKNSWVRRGAKVILINIAVLASLLFTMEAGFRFFRPGYRFYSRTQPGQFEDSAFGARGWPRKDSDLGWVLNDETSLSGTARPPFLPPDFYKEGREPNALIPNRQGFRDTKDFATIDYLSGKTRVMMLGDSFLFGVWLDLPETISAILERKLPDCEFYNLGIPGWGLDQMYLSYKKYADLIKPQIVVLLYIDDDVPRSYEAFKNGINKPSFSVSQNQLVPRTSKSESLWRRYVIDKSIIANKLYVIYRDIDIKHLANALFAALITETHERGQQFVVLRLPLLSDGPEAWSFKQFFAEKNSFYIDLRDQMPREKKFYIPNDQHFSAIGTAYVAEFISKLDLFKRRRNQDLPY
jgi:hypothetical protein